MRKMLLLMLIALFASMGLATRTAVAQETKEKAAAPEKQVRWHGTIVRMDKEGSTLTVRRQGVDKTVLYDSSTRWTRGTKKADPSEFKDGMEVMCVGNYDEKGVLHATRIDLRRQ